MDNSRKKSCDQCRLAKTRCSLDAPTCLRCQKKNTPCKYGHRRQSSNQSPFVQTGIFHSWLASTNSEPMLLSATGSDDFVEFDRNGPLEINDSRISGNLEFQVPSNLGTDDFMRPEIIDWSDQRRTPGPERWTPIGQRANQQQTERMLEGESICGIGPQCRTSVQDEDIPYSGQVIPITAQEGDIASYMSAMKHSSKLVQASWQAVKEFPEQTRSFLTRKQPTKVSSLTVGNILWAKIELYPTELSRKQLPPFIHHTCCRRYTGGRDPDPFDLPEPLANCSSIVPMYQNRIPGCENLVFRTLILEVQRIHDGFQSYDDMTLIHALQALTIYMIILASDEHRCKNVEVSIRIAMGQICLKVQNDLDISESGARGIFPAYKDWIRDESRRRTVTLLHLMNMLLDMNTEKVQPPSCSGLDPIALPCSKAMWEAETKAAWELEYKRHLSTRKGSGMLKCGNMRLLNDTDVISLGSDVVENLSSWSKGIDSFGAMVLLALQQGLN